MKAIKIDRLLYARVICYFVNFFNTSRRNIINWIDENFEFLYGQYENSNDKWKKGFKDMQDGVKDSFWTVRPNLASINKITLTYTATHYPSSLLDVTLIEETVIGCLMEIKENCNKHVICPNRKGHQNK